MKKKGIYFVSLILILIFSLNLSKVRASETIREIVKKDSWITNVWYNDNFGEEEEFYICIDNYDKFETFLYFDFSKKPNNWHKVELSLNITSISRNLVLNIQEIKEEWNEISITYANRPVSYSKEISFEVSKFEENETSRIIKFDVSSLISSSQSDLSSKDRV